MYNPHLHGQAAGWMRTIEHFIRINYYHPAYDFIRDGVIDACDLQYVVNLWLHSWGFY